MSPAGAALHHVTLRLRAHDPVEPRLDDDDAPPPAGAVVHEEPHVAWWFVARPGEVEAHYRFDAAYAAAHPEALDRAHLAMLAALLTFKLFDDGDVLIPPRQLAGVLRWPSLDERPRPLAAMGA